jgi:hypothetical protein
MVGHFVVAALHPLNPGQTSKVADEYKSIPSSLPLSCLLDRNCCHKHDGRPPDHGSSRNCTTKSHDAIAWSIFANGGGHHGRYYIFWIVSYWIGRQY